MSPDCHLSQAQAAKWAAQLGGALKALRLNRHFPPWRHVAAHLRAIPCHKPVRWSQKSGLPASTEWMELAAARELAPSQLHRWQPSEGDAPNTAKRIAAERHRLAMLAALPDLPHRQITVRLRQRAGDHASYLIVVERFDPTTVTIARYTLIMNDRPGTNVSDGELELRAAEHFHTALCSLTTQDAALAYAVLSAEVEGVEEVVRGVVGPAFMRSQDGRAWGADDLRPLGINGPVLSACLERASRHIPSSNLDDPLVDSVVLPRLDVPFGVSRRRKWAAPTNEVPILKQWIAEQGSRNLIYSYGSST